MSSPEDSEDEKGNKTHGRTSPLVLTNSSSPLATGPLRESESDDDLIPPKIDVGQAAKKREKKGRKGTYTPLLNKKPQSTRVRRKARRTQSSANVVNTSGDRSFFSSSVVATPIKKSGPSELQKKHRREMNVLRLRMNDKDLEIKKLTVDVKKSKRKMKELEEDLMRKNKKLGSETGMRVKANAERYAIQARLKKMQNAVAARLKLLGIDLGDCNSIGEALDASLSAIQQLVAQLAEAEAQMADMEADKEGWEKTIAEQAEKIRKYEELMREQSKTINTQKGALKSQRNQIKELKEENKQLTEERDTLREELDKLKKQHKSHKKNSQANNEELLAQIEELEGDKADLENANKKKDDLIEKLRKQIAELTASNKEKDETINSRDEEVANLKKTLEDRDSQIEE